PRDPGDEFVHPSRGSFVRGHVRAVPEMRLEQDDDSLRILHALDRHPPPPPSMSLLGAVRCLGSNTFSASSALRITFSITSCLTVLPVRPASFAISAAFS